MDYNVKQLLEENGCSPQFIADAMRFEKLFKGDIDSFIDHVEDILMSEEEEDDLVDDEDDILDDEEEDPIYKSDCNYDGNEDNIYFEDEDGEEACEEDEEDE